MKINTQGATRIVFIFDKFVIKIPRCCVKNNNKFYGVIYGILQGWLCNRNEYLWSKSKIYTFLIDVKSFLFSLIIIMPYAKQLTKNEFRKLNKFNFNYEHKIDSYGKYKDKIKVIDYG